jgi:hypothetical protein
LVQQYRVHGNLLSFLESILLDITVVAAPVDSAHKIVLVEVELKAKMLLNIPAAVVELDLIQAEDPVDKE